MGGINVGRWILGGIVAGIVIWIIEGAASVLYMTEMEEALAGLGLSIEMNVATWAITVIVSLIAGLTLVFFYAAARPRFGPGAKTATIVAVALWFGGYFLSLLGYEMLGLFPTPMLATWGFVGLIEMIIASIAGAWLYREEERGSAPI